MHFHSLFVETSIGAVLAVYLLCEATFFVLFYWVFLPYCNRPLLRPHEFRSYKEDRTLLLRRITRRIERTCQATGKSFLPRYASFLHLWFHDENRTDEQGNRFQRESNDQLPFQGDIDDLFAWAFFGLDGDHLEPWMATERDRMYDMLRNDFGVIFPPGNNRAVKPMRLSLDHADPGYRPMAIYLLFGWVQLLGKLFLRFVGFRPYRTTSGLRYWYRPRRTDVRDIDVDDSILPTLFFHGIAPGGLTPYIPLLLWGLGRDGRPLFLFENPAITFQVCFRSPTEEETLNGIEEALATHLFPGVDITVMGHSLGTCQVTWMIHSPQAHRIKQAVILDPVSILLSEPDVMTNFLYSRNAWKARPKRSRLGVVANELFIEHYLRRQFAWCGVYNSELWLDDVPPHCKLVVGLSENDDVLNFPKVKCEVELHMNDICGSMTGVVRPKANMEVLEWRGATHAQCIMRPDMWEQIRSAMRRQENLIRKESGLGRKTE